jgi:hypothetical protein
VHTDAKVAIASRVNDLRRFLHRQLHFAPIIRDADLDEIAWVSLRVDDALGNDSSTWDARRQGLVEAFVRLLGPEHRRNLEYRGERQPGYGALSFR